MSSANDEVVRLLKQAYNDELETVLNYLANSLVLEGVHAHVIAEELRADIDEELHHAEELGDRLKQLGVDVGGSEDFDVNQSFLQPPSDNTDVLSVIDGVIEAEEDAIEGYRELIDAAEAADDHATEDLAVELLRDEESHRTEFQKLRSEYE